MRVPSHTLTPSTLRPASRLVQSTSHPAGAEDSSRAAAVDAKAKSATLNAIGLSIMTLHQLFEIEGVA